MTEKIIKEIEDYLHKKEEERSRCPHENIGYSHCSHCDTEWFYCADCGIYEADLTPSKMEEYVRMLLKEVKNAR